MVSILPKKEDEGNRLIRQLMEETRNQRGVTQERLAGLLGKSQKNYSDMARGRSEISATDLMHIAVFLEKPIRFLLPLNCPEPEKLTEEQFDLLSAFNQIRNRALEKIAIEQVRKLAETSIEADNEETRRDLDIVRGEVNKVRGKGIHAVAEASQRGWTKVAEMRDEQEHLKLADRRKPRNRAQAQRKTKK